VSDRIYTNDTSEAIHNVVTIAEACRGTLAKTNFANGSQTQYDRVKFFNFTEYEIGSLHDLYSISLGLLDNSRCCFIRARVMDERKSRGVVRKQNETLIADKFNWVVIDADWKDAVASGNIVEDSQKAISRLPECFHGCEYFAVASASYCFKPGIRIKLFFWSQNAVSNLDMKNCLHGRNEFDPAVYQPIQLIYTARPNGVDTVKNRITYKKPLFPKQLKIVITDHQHMRGEPEVWYTLERAKRNKSAHLFRISLLSEGDRHEGLIREGLPLGKLVGQGHFEEENIIEEVLEVCSSWIGKHDTTKDRATITWAIQKGIAAMESDHG